MSYIVAGVFVAAAASPPGAEVVPVAPEKPEARVDSGASGAPVPLVLREGPRPLRDGGIGASLASVPEGVVLERIAPGMGADTAGLKPGSLVVAVDGRSVAGRPVAEVASWIRGEKGSTVLLDVRRADAVERVSIVRTSLKDPRMQQMARAIRDEEKASGKPPPEPPKRVDPTGSPAPQVTVDRWFGAAPDLGPTLAGRVLLLDFWATWCGPCRHTLPALSRLANELGPKGLRVVGLSIDEDAADVEAFLQKNPLPYPVGWTAGQSLGAYGGEGIPLLVLVGPDGRVQWTHQGGALPEAAIRTAVAALRE